MMARPHERASPREAGLIVRPSPPPTCYTADADPDKVRQPGREVLGFALAEFLVAAALFAIAVAVGFTLYSDAARFYRLGVQRTVEQQNVRTAFDRLLSEIRLAGFNTNPDGDRSRVDEQIEGAWATAITIRADLDFGNPGEDSIPELSLAEPRYRVVSTGNDEIVTYALAKAGPSGSDSLTFTIDADRPRSGTSKTITIPNIALVHNNPPYTLFRITLADVPGPFPASPQSTTSFVYEPIAEGIRSLNFAYYADDARLLSPDTPSVTSDDIGGDDSGERLRAQVRGLQVSIAGMPLGRDPAAVQTVEAGLVPSKSTALSSRINLENMGKTAIKDSDSESPAAPDNVRLVPGHCRGMLVTWRDPRPDEDIGGFVIRYWPKGSDASVYTARFPYPAHTNGNVDRHGHAFVDGLTDGVTYCFQVCAFDVSGNLSPWSSLASVPCAQVSEWSTPSTPGDFTATGGQPRSDLDGMIALQWTQVATNTNHVQGDPDSSKDGTTIRDLQGYRVYRDIRNDFIPNDGSNLLEEVPPGVGRYTDHDVANCKTYYYKLVALDRCNVTSAPTPVLGGRAETGVPPATPLGLTALRLADDRNALSWTAVHSNANGVPVFVDQYRVYFYKTLLDLPPADVKLKTFSPRATLDNAPTSYDDPLDLSEQSDLMRGWRFYYAVSAADRCGNESTKSDPVGLSCTVDAILDLTPTDGDSGSGIILIILRPDSQRRYSRARVQIVHKSDPDTIVYDQQSTRIPFLFPTWDARALGSGDYRIHWGLITDDGCSSVKTTDFVVKPRPEGGLTTTTPTATTIEDNRKLSWDLVNTTGADLEIVRIDVTWFSLQRSPRLTSIEYPTGRVVSSLPTGGPQMASQSFDISPLRLTGEMNGLCQEDSCRLNMSLVWDEPVFSGRSASAERVTVRYHVRDARGRTGNVALVVWPDLSIRMGKLIGSEIAD